MRKRAERRAAFTVAVFLAMACPGPVAAADAPSGNAPAHEYVLGIEGMSCSVGCPPYIEGALKKIDGVESAEVSFDDKRAVVKMAAGKTLDQKACNKALGNSGYYISSFEERSNP
ncbi:MAG: cation transporter [Deltaproteobacteria bacterium]